MLSIHSPFVTEVQSATQTDYSKVDVTKVVVSGEGAKPAQPVPASLPVSFVVDGRAAGQAPLGVELKVSASRGFFFSFFFTRTKAHTVAMPHVVRRQYK